MPNKYNYTEAKEAYIEWLLTPPGERTPETKTEFAEDWGTNRTTLYRWEQSDEFQAALRQTKARWGVVWHGEIIGKLMEIVRTRSDGVAVQAAKELLRHFEIDTSDDKDGDLSEEQLQGVKKALKEAGFQVLGE